MKSAYADYTPTELPKGFLTYEDIRKRTNARLVSNYWYKNGARLVCESIAGVGTGKALGLDMSLFFLPKLTEEIKNVYGHAYEVYNELCDMIKSYDKEYGALLN